MKWGSSMVYPFLQQLIEKRSLNHPAQTPVNQILRIKWLVSTIRPNALTHPPRATSGTKLSPGELSPRHTPPDPAAPKQPHQRPTASWVIEHMAYGTHPVDFHRKLEAIKYYANAGDHFAVFGRRMTQTGG